MPATWAVGTQHFGLEPAAASPQPLRGAEGITPVGRRAGGTRGEGTVRPQLPRVKQLPSQTRPPGGSASCRERVSPGDSRAGRAQGEGWRWAPAGSPSPCALPQVSLGNSVLNPGPLSWPDSPPSTVLSLARPTAWGLLEVGTQALGVTGRDFRVEVGRQALCRFGRPGRSVATVGETIGAQLCISPPCCCLGLLGHLASPWQHRPSWVLGQMPESFLLPAAGRWGDRVEQMPGPHSTPFSLPPGSKAGVSLRVQEWHQGSAGVTPSGPGLPRPGQDCRESRQGQGTARAKEERTRLLAQETEARPSQGLGPGAGISCLA